MSIYWLTNCFTQLWTSIPYLRISFTAVEFAKWIEVWVWERCALHASRSILERYTTYISCIVQEIWFSSGNHLGLNSSQLTHSWSWALLEKPPIVQPLKNFSAFHGTRKFITVFIRALHWSLSWTRSIQSILTHLRLGLPSGLFLPTFPPISYMHFSSHAHTEPQAKL
jgi:hypothetical protein